MDDQVFQKCSQNIIDYIINYKETVGGRDVVSEVLPGYLKELIPAKAPEKPEEWEIIMKDVNRVILPGLTHWQHPHFFSHFAAGNSYESLCGDILSGGIGCVGFSWASSPAYTELEILILNWLAQMLQLPDFFLPINQGCGIIHDSACEAILMAFFSARNKTIEDYQKTNPEDSCPYDIMSRLVAYTSDQANAYVERSGLLAMIPVRKIKSNEKHEIGGQDLRKAIEQDVVDGKIPFFCAATLGTTNSCAFDRLDELGPICQEFNIWLHVDAAYAGSSFICPEYRHLLNGVEFAMSFSFSPDEWLLVNIDCCCVWFRQPKSVSEPFLVNSRFLKHKHQEKLVDFRHMQISLSRRFRALKLWFVLRCNGVKKLQEFIRNHVRLAHYFEDLLVQDGRFEIVEEVKMGLVCFKSKGDSQKTIDLFEAIVADGRIHLDRAKFDQSNCSFLRFAIVSQSANDEDMKFAYKVISVVLTRLQKTL